jgi:hypothetical protein
MRWLVGLLLVLGMMGCSKRIRTARVDYQAARVTACGKGNVMLRDLQEEAARSCKWPEVAMCSADVPGYSKSGQGTLLVNPLPTRVSFLGGSTAPPESCCTFRCPELDGGSTAVP